MPESEPTNFKLLWHIPTRVCESAAIETFKGSGEWVVIPVSEVPTVPTEIMDRIFEEAAMAAPGVEHLEMLVTHIFRAQRHNDTCVICEGTGTYHHAGLEMTCPTCNGSGIFHVPDFQ